MARRAIAARIIDPQFLTLVEFQPEKLAKLKAELQCQASEKIDAATAASELVVLAVKPQEHALVCSELGPLLSADTTVLSVMTGLRVVQLRKALAGHLNLIRAMPNLAIQVGQGFTGVFAGAGSGPTAIKKALAFLATGGELSQVSDEGLLDAITSASASGPGFVYFLLEAYIEATEALGFDHETAERITRATFEGSLGLWRAAGKTPTELRAQVTSAGGTTFAGIQHLTQGQVSEHIKECLLAALKRAKELSGS